MGQGTIEHRRRAAELLARARMLVDEASQLLAAPAVVPRRNSTPQDPDGTDAALTDAAPSDAALLDAVDIAERLTAAAAAAGTRAAVAFRASQIARQRALGVRSADLGRGIAEEVALARRISPSRASNQLALGRVLVDSMPRTVALLARGDVSAWAADEVAKAALVLEDPDRARLDEDLAAALPTVTAHRAGVLARARATELDPSAALARLRREVAQRHVSLRPVSDAMVRLSALMPSAQGVAAFAALDRAAASARAAGSDATRGQEMADEVFRRLTGLDRIEQAGIEIRLLMTDTALLGGGEDVAWVDGAPVPAVIARHLALGHAGDGQAGRRWIRRLYTDPITRTLRDADERRRLFSGALRGLVEMRDQGCRGPWCDGATRHVHHVRGHAEGGTTTADNGVGVCERLNHVVEMPGWKTEMLRGDVLRITTPTGRRDTSTPPPLVIASAGTAPPGDEPP